MSGRLSGKVCLVTGTGGSMGRATAVTFAREGARLVGCDAAVEAPRASTNGTPAPTAASAGVTGALAARPRSEPRRAKERLRPAGRSLLCDPSWPGSFVTWIRARSGQGPEPSPGGVARSAGINGLRPSSSVPLVMAVPGAPSSASRPPAGASPPNARSPRSIPTWSRSCTRPAIKTWIPPASGSTPGTMCGGAVLTADMSGAPAYGHARPGQAAHGAPGPVSAPRCAPAPRPTRARSEHRHEPVASSTASGSGSPGPGGSGAG
jgi:hypothetical protein